MSDPSDNKQELKTSVVLGDITSSKIVGKDTTIVIPCNTHFFPEVYYIPTVQGALRRRTSEDLISVPRNKVIQEFGEYKAFKHGDFVKFKSNEVPGYEKWKDDVPENIIFVVGSKYHPLHGNMATADVVEESVYRVLVNYNAMREGERIAFPLIGSGIMKLSHNDSFKATKRAVQRFQKELKSGLHLQHIQDIKIVVYPSVAEEIEELQKIETNTEETKSLISIDIPIEIKSLRLFQDKIFIQFSILSIGFKDAYLFQF